MNFKGKGCKNKGITLIALVITIIVLLILAGVTIAMLSGDNSAPQKATEAAQKDAIAGAKDEIAMEVQEALLNYYNNTYVKGNITEGASTQSVVEEAAGRAVENAEKRNSQLLESSGVSDNTITLNTKSYTVTGTIEENGGITWSDTKASTGDSGEETSTTRTVEVDSFADLNSKAELPSKKNTIVKKETEGEEQQVVIPAGFKQATDSADTLEGGIVIEDASEDSTKKGNQFVWVPVEQKIKFHDGEMGVIQLGRYDFLGDLDAPKEGKDVIEDYFTEISDESGARDIEEFKTQTNKAKGYYIGRYEMGKENENEAVCKAGVLVYNGIEIEKAKEESRNLYNDVKKGETTIYTSDLINSYAWDTAIVYIMKCDKDGNYYAYQGDDIGKLSNTGDRGDEKCKINDMAGNMQELTTERSSFINERNAIEPYVFRGGQYADYYWCAGARAHLSNVIGTYYGFRPILYIVGLNA